VFAAARAGEPAAVELVEHSVRFAGRAIVTMAMVLNPELVVIGGGVADAGDVLIDPLRRRLEQMARLPPRLEASALGARGPLLGAVRHALDDVETRLLDGLAPTA
jgi:predicted NBD/HSP70 family sugar kinase